MPSSESIRPASRSLTSAVRSHALKALDDMRDVIAAVRRTEGEQERWRRVLDLAKDLSQSGIQVRVHKDLPEPLPAGDPLLTTPNLIITPHVGSATRAARERMAELAVDNLLAALQGSPMPHQANPGVGGETRVAGTEAT